MPRPRPVRTALAVLAALAVAAPPVALLASAPAVAGPPPTATAEPKDVVTSGPLRLENSFVSAVGWVKPGEQYPSRLIVTNTGTGPLSGVSVTATAPTGTAFVSATGATVTPSTLTWAPGTLAAGASRTLVVRARAATTAQDPRVVWKNIASSARAAAPGVPATAVARSHGPKVIPNTGAGEYDTARFGDRPFPVVPVEYSDRKYNGGTPANPVPAAGGQGPNTAEALDKAINDPANPGSTFNLFQEMSYGQLFPKGTVPALGKTEAYGVKPLKPFTTPAPGGTCTGITTGGTPLAGQGSRVVDGKYQLPGSTEYYGRDKYGSNVVGGQLPVAVLSDIDGGCGPTAKLVYDSAVVADPDIDYSDYDTDKDGVVDFFMVVFAGCGGNGGSQLAAVACPDALSGSYDNVWPHSSSLEGTYTDPATGLRGYISQDQLKDLEGRPLWYTDTRRTTMTTTDRGAELKVLVRVGPYNVNPETAIDKASVISHEYGHSLGLPDFYSGSSRETYGDWNLMATDKSQFMDVYSRQRMGWVVPDVVPTGSTTVTMKDGKADTQRIAWQTPSGAPYVLSPQNGDQGVHNGQAYVAKLPGRKLLDESILTAKQGSRLWHSGAGNDFGCSPDKGHNLDVVLKGTERLPAGTTIRATFDSAFNIEWDYDYGFVLAGSRTGSALSLTSQPSENGYTTSRVRNPNASGCLQALDNGITGSSAVYGDPAQREAARATGDLPPAVFVQDAYDVSELAGKEGAFLRFSYATDPGFAGKGWFIDNFKVVATPPAGAPVTLFDQSFEDPEAGGPEGASVFNGGCKEGLRTGDVCTAGWSYVAKGGLDPLDHAYYLELRDRSGFDASGRGENDRDPILFEPGLSLVYADEAHGDGNLGVDDPPAQHPLDAVPQPGESAPELKDAAWTAAAGRNAFSDTPVNGRGRFDNFTDPSRPNDDKVGTTPWEFDFSCLTFKVNSMSGTGTDERLPFEAGADVLTADVTLTGGKGCAALDTRSTDVAAAPGTTPSTPTTASPSASASPTSSAGVLCAPAPTSAFGTRRVDAGRTADVVVRGTPGTPVELHGYSRPSTDYRVVRTGRIGADGTVSWTLRPSGNTRVYAQQPGCPAGPSTAVSVRATVSLDMARTGTRAYRFTGNSLPTRSAGLPVRVYRVADGREVLIGTTRADSRGRWTLSRSFSGTGTFGFLARVPQDSSHDAGVSARRTATVR